MIQLIRTFRKVTLALLLFGVAAFAHGQTPASTPGTNEVIVLPKSVPDPIEPINRVMWGFNKALMTDAIKPTSKIYRSIVRKPVRTGIGNIGNNLKYPGRAINNLLQGKWAGARDESYRFLYNSTVGVAGFFDVATKRGIPKSDADFGQTFGQWGWKPHFYLMVPITGPSNDRDAIGSATDTAANPLIYISPYNFRSDNPLTYLGPYTYFNYAVTYNDLSSSVDEYVRFSQAEMDPYSEIQYAWTFARENRVADFRVKGEKDESSLETLESVFFTYKDKEFPNHGETRSVLIPSTKRKLEFTYWLQPKKANVVYIIPGLGSHRMAQATIALAELVYKNGFSAVCISSAFNSEFMENASTVAMPAYLPADGHDVQVALTEVDRRLRAMYPGRMERNAMIGYSMGALHTLYAAATESTNQLPLIKFDRFLAINTPVRLLHGVSKLDEFYQAPLEWPQTQRTTNIENTFLKVADLSKSTLTPQTSLPFSAIESRFLVGLTFRLMLRDIVYSSQRRNNQGVLRHPIKRFRRDPVYQEIMQYSYHDYFEKFVVPYYETHGVATPVSEALDKAGDLRSYETGLRANPNIRVMVNQNDFLLDDEDLAWLRATFTADQLTVFEKGGHLGNLFNPNVQRTILGALANMKDPKPD